MNKKLLVLLGAYVGGIAAALVYNKKTPQEIKTELEKASVSKERSCKVLFNNFLEIHKNLLEDLKARIDTPKNREYFNNKKDEFLSLAEDYKIKAQEIAEEYKT
ncbi:MAG: hypothetical protein PHE25_06095, partial [Candidatus Gracilibacteria bacterium]|nr:hypothetical protein [Candidatus Gracilibacteria bacterium]